jgi:cobalt-zinc-cadmium resistance protein CzcA
LATVVVGGLITATALTLIVLPVLYALFDSKEPKKKFKTRPAIIALLLVTFGFSAQSQTKPISLDEAVEIAIQNNQGLKASASKITQSEQLVKSAFNLDKTQLYYLNDQNNIAENGIAIRTFGISQSFQFPTVYGAQKDVQLGMVDMNSQQYEMDKRLVSKEVSRAYYTVLYWQNVVENYSYLDSLFKQFSNAAKRRFEEGETNYLEKLTAEAKQRELGLLLQQGRESVEKAYIQLHQWLQSDSSYTVPKQEMPMLSQSNFDVSDNPGLKYFELAQSLSSKSLSLEQQKLLPDLHLNIFQGTNNGPNAKRYSGFQAGIGIPLFFGAEKSRINAAKTQMEITENQFNNYKTQLVANLASKESDLKKYQEALDYYNNSGQVLSAELISNGSLAFQNGEIDFLQYIQLLDNAKSIEITYLENLFNYNLTLLDINYISNQ